MNAESLKLSIEQYEIQLAGVMKSLETENGSGRSDLIDLKADLEQLIHVSKDYLKELLEQNIELNSQENEIDQEYSSFMSEIAALDEPKEQNIPISPKQGFENLNDNLAGIIGMKCLVSHTHNSGRKEKHLAMVSEICSSSDVQNMEDIQVKVMFTHPTLQEMLPCPYFLNGDCKYDADECQYSHGKVVSLINLQDYDKPDFSRIENGDSVLVKQTNQLWSKATVTDIEDNMLTVSSDGKTHCMVNFEDIIPIEQITLQDDVSSSSDDSFEDDCSAEAIMPQVRTFTFNDSNLAEWEKYTKGIGSKLMLAMGYKMGKGLGKQSEGRVEPVPVQILPSRMSLDHCMKMREDAGGDENLFSINRHIKKMRKKLVNQNVKNDFNHIRKNDVFGLINEMFSNKTTNKPQHRQILISSSSKELNVSSFQLGENIKKTKKDILKYEESLKRQKSKSTSYKEIYQKLEAKRLELQKLKNDENAVSEEQQKRKNKSKLDIF